MEQQIQQVEDLMIRSAIGVEKYLPPTAYFVKQDDSLQLMEFPFPRINQWTLGLFAEYLRKRAKRHKGMVVTHSVLMCNETEDMTEKNNHEKFMIAKELTTSKEFVHIYSESRSGFRGNKFIQVFRQDAAIVKAVRAVCEASINQNPFENIMAS